MFIGGFVSITGIDPSSSYLSALTSAEMGSSSAQPQDQVMSAVAQVLGVSTSQLQSDLSAGQSFQSIAQANGVSTDQLVSTITQALQSSGSSSVSSLITGSAPSETSQLLLGLLGLSSPSNSSSSSSSGPSSTSGVSTEQMAELMGGGQSGSAAATMASVNNQLLDTLM
jgi:hypothetical protein